MQRTLLPLLFALTLGFSSSDTRAQAVEGNDGVEAALRLAGENRDELETALRGVPEAQREAMRFLIANMPERDLETLDAAFLIENVSLAHEAHASAPWRDSIPRHIFLNDVLPYVNVTEKRERWRADFRKRFAGLVADCKTPGEAAQVLNRKIFKDLGVRYSTKRKRADQSPSESIEIGMASCTGLSILLVDACRAVGAPARLAGIPSWVNKRGNHTWVEVWDGSWRYLGAAEPGEFDKTWFSKDAALAKADSRRHAIYAVSYRKTGLLFPMVWSRENDQMHAVNVTHRYAKPTATADKTRLMVRVRAREDGPRIEARVEIARSSNPEEPLRGTSKGESNDTNDFLTFEVPRNASFEIRVTHGDRAKKISWQSADKKQDLVDVVLDSDREPDSHAALVRAAAKWFAATPEQRKSWEFDAALESLIASDPAAAKRAVWSAYRKSPRHDDLRANHAARRVRSGEHESPYTLKRVGEKPARGWPVFIAMHGGGGTTKRFNDSQWRHMQVYYRDQPDVGGYLYLALRAPNDKWNGFYDHYVWPLVTRLVRQLVVCEEVDSDKIYLMGYSHGGYGAFAIGPNIPDRFAAIHASAAAPTPGISPAVNLRNVRFTYMIGEKDTRYGRAERCQKFAKEIAALRGSRTDIYPVTMEFEKGRGHGGLPDRDKIRTMYASVRTPMPRAVTWRPTGGTVHDFYWLSIAQPASKQEVHATCEDNVITIQTKGVRELTLCLDERLIDFSKTVHVRINGKKVARKKLVPSLHELCRSLWRRGDTGLTCTTRLDFGLED